MKVSVKYGSIIKEFIEKSTITIGNNGNCDITIGEIPQGQYIKLVYSNKYNNYVLVNSEKNSDILLNNNTFYKVLVPNNFVINFKYFPVPILIAVNKEEQKIQTTQNTTYDLFNNDIEQKRINIVKEMGFSVQELKNTISSLNITSFILNCSLIILSIVSAFGMTNFLLGLKVDNNASVLNLTTNVGFLICIAAIVMAVALILKNGVYSLLDFNSTRKFGDNPIIQKLIIGMSEGFRDYRQIHILLESHTCPGVTGAV